VAAGCQLAEAEDESVAGEVDVGVVVCVQRQRQRQQVEGGAPIIERPAEEAPLFALHQPVQQLAAPALHLAHFVRRQRVACRVHDKPMRCWQPLPVTQNSKIMLTLLQ
jgi:hypothetical protein